jgi:hypothetical protein
MNKRLGVLTKKTYVVSLLLSTCTGIFLFGLVLKVVVVPVVCSAPLQTYRLHSSSSELFILARKHRAQKTGCLDLAYFVSPALTSDRQLIPTWLSTRPYSLGPSTRPCRAESFAARWECT